MAEYTIQVAAATYQTNLVLAWGLTGEDWGWVVEIINTTDEKMKILQNKQIVPTPNIQIQSGTKY